MTANGIEERKAYYKAWRMRNKDKIREYQKRYWEKKSQDSTGTETPTEEPEQ